VRRRHDPGARPRRGLPPLPRGAGCRLKLRRRLCPPAGGGDEHGDAADGGA
jgi:hypothetical protein